MTTRPTREALIDLTAITANVQALAAIAGTDHLMAVVKARGYGHGAVESARAAVFGGADWLGVATIAEALELRAGGIDTPILAWLHGPSADFASAIERGVDIGVSSLEQLHRVAAASTLARVHLKVDTGLGRNGATLDDCAALFGAASAYEKRGQLRVHGLFSHLANAGEVDDAAQVAAFENAVTMADTAGLTPELRHLAATAGAIRVPAARFDMVRVGIGIYGLSPFDDGGAGSSAADLGLRPAMELSASIVNVKRVPAGSGVSYGYSYRTERETTLALVPLGYADGVPRQASNRGPVTIDGVTHRVAGRIAMDQFVVDVGDQRVSIGDRAVLFGDPRRGHPGADDWAAAADTINYEIVTRLGSRVEIGYRS
ncbi:alanine racemase [Marisediminicola senii]|uniref:alanine racemase n=1 Tax=Marisediminicola senii TaxID=2711233 RepID=UPI0013ED30B2|nr:alanine racemase [Marisediminicola senii]